ALFLGSRPIKINVIQNAMKIIGNVIKDDYWELYWGSDIRHELLRRDYENIPDDMPDGIYLVNEYAEEEGGQINEISEKGLNIGAINEVTQSSSASYVSYLSRACRVTVKEETELFNEWANGQMDNNNLTEQDFLMLARSPMVKIITEQAGSNMFSVKVQENELLDADNYNPTTFIHWTQVWPFKIQTAIDFWRKIPMKIRAVVSEEVDTWFFYLSGLFPCDKVMEKAVKSVSDLKKVVDHLECAGDSKKLREIAKQQLESKEKEIRQDVKQKLPEFLKSDAVQKRSITDFPEVYEFAVDFLNRNAGNDNIYSAEKGAQIPRSEFAIDELQKVNIYFINASQYENLLGPDGMNYFPANPLRFVSYFIFYITMNNLIHKCVTDFMP
ncbi:unnamed protein product, partial [marine sediment metagenome]